MKRFNLKLLILLMLIAVPIGLLGQAAAQAPKPAEVIPNIGHANRIDLIEISSDSKYIITGSGQDSYDIHHDNTIKLWDMNSGRLIRTLQSSSTESAAHATFMFDVNSLTSVDYAATVTTWDLATGNVLRRFSCADSISVAAASPNAEFVYCANSNGISTLLNIKSGTKYTIPKMKSYPEGASFSPDGANVLVWSFFMDNSGVTIATPSTLLVSAGSGSSIILPMPPGNISYFKPFFVPNGIVAAYSDAPNTLSVWDVNNKRRVRKLNIGSGIIQDTALTRDGNGLVVATGDGYFAMWNLKTGEMVYKFDSTRVMPSAHYPSLLRLSSDGRFLVVGGGANAALEIREAISGNLISELPGDTRINNLQVSQSGKVLFSHHPNGGVAQWDLTTGRLIARVGSGSPSGSFAVSEKDVLLLDNIRYDGDDRRTQTLQFWRSDRPNDWKLESAFENDIRQPTESAFVDNGRIASWPVYGGGAFIVRDSRTGKMVISFDLPGGDLPNQIAVSPDGARVFAAGEGRSILDQLNGSEREKRSPGIWNLITGQRLRAYESQWANLSSAAFLPSASQIIVGAILNNGSATSPLITHSLLLLNADTGSVERRFDGHTNIISAVAVSPDGRFVVSGSADKTVRVWRLADGRLMKIFRGHAASITTLAYGHDSSRIYSGGADGTIRIWNMESGKEIASLFAAKDEWLTLTPNGFFNGSGLGHEMVSVVRGLSVTSISQVFDKLYRPDLVEAYLSGDVEGKYKDEAHRLNLEAVLDTGPAPQLEHLSEKDERAGDTIRISLRVTGRGGGVGKRLLWRVDGITQGNTAAASLVDNASPLASVVVTETLKLVPGRTNVVEVTAYNRAELVATPPFRITVDKFGTSTGERPRMFVLALGVDAYRMQEYRLNYAAYDATTFAKALQKVGSSLFSEVKIKTLTNEQVSETGIAEAIDEIARQAKPDDVLVLFLGGHGKSIAGRYYYYPQTLDFKAGNSIEGDAIGQDKWEAWLARIPIQKSLLVIDTCEGDAFRGSRGTDSARQTAMDQLQRATGRNIIAASRDAAFEGYQGHGVLTYALLEALDVKSSKGGEDRVRVGALADYVGLRVPEISQKSFGIVQNPTRKLLGNDFPIGIRQSVLTTGTGPTIPKEPTHVVIREELLRELPAANAPATRTLAAGTQVRAVEFVGAWVIVARDGQKLGYVPVDALARMQ